MTTILVVDDSKEDFEIAARLLRNSENWVVFHACGYEEAIRCLKERTPDVVVSDVCISQKSSLDLVRQMKADYPTIPIVLMAEQGSEAIAVDALREGAANFIPKKLLAMTLTSSILQVLPRDESDRSESCESKDGLLSRLVFQIENDPELFTAAVNCIQVNLESLDCCPRLEMTRIGVALEEALLNAYYHGNLEIDSGLRDDDCKAYYSLAEERRVREPYKNRQIILEVELLPHRSKFTVRDEGAGFEVANIRDPTQPANIERPSGRGILLMQTFMDEMIFNETGNEVTLIKYHRT